jgi:hypothetical protein
MNESKILQNRFRKPLRVVVITLSLFLLVPSVILTVTFNSRSVQQRLFNRFVSPLLADYHVQADFLGFDYTFPASITLHPTSIYYSGAPIAALGQLEIEDIFWSRKLGISSASISSLQIFEDLSSSRFEAFIREFNDSTSASSDHYSPLILDIGSIRIDTLQFSFEAIPISNRLAIDHLVIGENVSVTGIDLDINASPYAANLAVSQLNLSPKGTFALDYSVSNDSIASVVGHVQGGEEELMFTGDLVAATHLTLDAFQAASLEPIVQGTQIGFNGASDSAGLTLGIFGGNKWYNLSGKVTGFPGSGYTISSKIDLEEEFYHWAVLCDFQEVFDVFKPKSIDLSAQTDLSDTSWAIELADSKNNLLLTSEGLDLPVRGIFSSTNLGIGPLQQMKAQFSLLPNIEAVVNDQDIQVLAAISSLSSNDVVVRGINAKYEHTSNQDTLWISSLDPNFDLEVQGSRKGDLNTVKGELNSLNLALIDPLDTGHTLMAKATLNFSDEGLGALLLQDAVLQRPQDVVFLRELSLTHVLTKKGRSLELSSDVLDFSINGRWNFDDFAPVGIHVFQDLMVQKPTPWPQSQFKFDIQAGDVGWIADLAHIDLDLSEDTHIFGKYNNERKIWSTTMFVPSGRFEGIEAQDIMLTSSQSELVHNTTLKVDQISNADWQVSGLNLSSKGQNLQNDIRCHGTVEDSISSDFYLAATVNSGFASLSNLSFNIGESFFALKDQAQIKWQADLLDVDSLVLEGDDGTLTIAGELLTSKESKLSFYINALDSKVLNYIVRSPQAVLSGKLNSTVTLTNSLAKPNLSAQLLYKDFGLNGFEYGKFTANARLKNLEDLSMRGQLRQGNRSSFYFNGGFDLAKQEIDLRASLDAFAINSFNPMLGGILDELTGNLQGGLEIYGPLDQYNLNGAFTLTDGHFTVPIVGSELSTAQPLEIQLTEKAIILDSTLFFVPADSTLAVVYGGISHSRFDSLNFDLKLHGDSIRAVDMARNIDGYFYGTAVVMGDLLLEGPLEQLHLDLAVATKDGTNFKIPLDNPTAVELPSYIRFTDANLPKSDTTIARQLEYFTTDIAIQATPQAAIELVLDEVLGDVIKARGSGNLRLKLLEDESLELYGLYTIESGDYLFTLQNIINKPFEVIPGGTILWSGDLYEAEVDIDAKYSLSTDLQGLVTNANYNNENVDVDLIINLSGALMNPEIGFSVDLPNAPASYLEELERHFLNDDAMNYQAFSLLLLGEFYQQDLAVQEGFDIGSSVGRNTSELLVSEFGSWLAAGIGSYVDLELDYTSGTNPYATLGNTQNNLNLGLGKDFLDGRLSVNSSLDIPIGQTGTSTLLLGDTEVVYSITKDGKIKLRAFNRSNRNDPLMQNSGPYTQGVGIMYHKEFEKVLND